MTPSNFAVLFPEGCASVFSSADSINVTAFNDHLTSLLRSAATSPTQPFIHLRIVVSTQSHAMPTSPINTVTFKPKRRSTTATAATAATAPNPTTANANTAAIKTQKNSKPNDKSANGWDNLPQIDSFSSYMHHKNRKLREQFTSEFSKSSSTSTSTSIFKNVVVWVNGHTKPSRLEIRRIMGIHGGRLETYLTPRVTHVVASNLATATRLRLSSNKSSTTPRVKLVSPQWITQCLAQKKKLPESQYPIPFMDNPNQTSLNSFFSPRPIKHTPISKPTSHTTPLPQSPLPE